MPYTLTQHKDSHIELVIDGKISDTEMTQLLDSWIQATAVMDAAGIKDATLLYRIENFAMPSLTALMEEMSRMSELWQTMRYFAKMAVVSEQQWIQRVSEFEGWLIPNLEVKGFNPADVDAARAWLGV